MRWSLFYIAVISITICSCGGNDQNDNSVSIPENLRLEVEEFIDAREEAFDHQFETYEGIDWDYPAITSNDSSIYPFAVIYERDGKKYPFKHKAIISTDTLMDILQFNHLYNNWESIMPIPYDVREEEWWFEIIQEENIENIISNSRKLQLLDSTHNSWQELFIGDVILAFGTQDTLWADTLIWNPKLGTIRASECKIKTYNNGASAIVFGAGFEGNSDMTKWSIKNANAGFYE